MNVIPVINCPDVACVQKKLAIAKTFLPDGAMVHLDVTDGSFSAHRTWADPMEWVKLRAPFALEVHLMVDHPEQYVDNWLVAGAQRLIVHAETLTPQSMQEIFSTAERYRAEVMLSSGPEYDMEDIAPYLRHFTSFQVLAVHPGPSEQPFLPFAGEKVRFLREEAPDAIIEVDGGMNSTTAQLVKALGADTITSESYIFGSADPRKAYEELVAI